MALRLASSAAVFLTTSLLAATPVWSADMDVSAHEHAAQEPTTINVILNQARIIKLSRPASTIVIGNPAIADATVQDARTIVLTGRGFGRTNMVILDQTGTPIFDEKVAVTRDQLSTLRVYRRANIETLSCEPYCESAYLTEAEIESTRERARVNLLFD